MQICARRCVRQLLPAVIALAAPGQASATNGYFQHGYGNLAKGMGGVGYALPLDALASATNPAGLALLSDRLDVGLDWISPRRSASIEGNRQLTLRSADGEWDGDRKREFWVPEFGYRNRFTDSLSYGIALYGNGGLNTDYRDNPYAGFGSTGRAGVDLAQLFLTPALAWRIGDRHAIGIAVNLVYQRFKAYGLDAFSTAQFPGPYSESPDRLTNNGYDESFGVGYRLGWIGEPLDRLTVGASWQPKTRMSKFDRYRGLFPDQGRFDIPENYGAGIAYRLADSVFFSADVQRINYDKVPALGSPIRNFTDGALLGSDNGPGFGWRAMTVYKTGLGWRISPLLTVRGGYIWTRQPVPADQTLFNILAPAVVERHYTLGLSYAISSRVSVSAYYCKGPNHLVRGMNSIPPNQLLDPLPPASLGGGEADVQLSGQSAGVSLGFAF